jgi:phosphohistidine phosphatase
LKTLLLLRHGKAQPDAPHGDKERLLIERGKRDSATIGRKIEGLVDHLDSIITSDAQRAHETAIIAAAAARYSGTITIEPDIYDAGLDTLLNVIRRLPDSSECVMLVGHNPGFGELSAALSQEGTPPTHLPTAGLAHIEFDALHWRDVRTGTGRLLDV